MSQPNNQLFIIGSDLLKAVSVDDAEATCAAAAVLVVLIGTMLP